MISLCTILLNLFYPLIQESETAQKTAESTAGQGENIGDVLVHHVQNSREFDFLFFKVHLPQFPTILGIDFSITKHVVMLWIAAALVFIIFTFGVKWKGFLPKNKFTTFFEYISLFIRDEIVYANFGAPGGRKFTPFFLTIFFFILSMNLLGLIPMMSTATGNINVTAGLASISFILIQVAGIVNNGFFKHWKNYIPSGVPWFLVPIFIPVEIMGMFAKPFALCIRLFANMTAGHIVIFAFLGVIILLKNIFVSVLSVPLACAICMLELFIAFLQAYIFTFLTALFVSMTYHPSH
jgi:F-type H+-transporting ATPase subunit a